MTSMAARTANDQYNGVAKFMHWLIALAIIAMLALGWIMTSLEPGDPHKFALFQLHKSIGITILLLSLFRLGWRLTHKVPPPPPGAPRWQVWLASAVHFTFYLLIIGMPLSGWVIVSTSAFNMPTLLYGFIPLPHLPVLPDLAAKKSINAVAGEGHALAAYLLAGLLCLHIAAALKHHFLDRDDVLLRMEPRFTHRVLNKIRGGA